ncbi:MAG: PH domain-containing protein [Gammaproteobacteria bacterium]|nr:PH domain-containing protein [Gammaproteobacteria bacterium]
MSHIENNLSPDETIAYRTKKSIIIFSFPMTLLVVGLGFYGLLMYTISLISPLQNLMNQHPIGQILLVILLAIASFSFLKVWLEYITASFVVTNRRLIMKEGFFVRRMSETRLTAISHVSVHQNLIGQLFNFGTVFINSFGGTSDNFTQITSPVEFQRQVHSQLDKLPR